MREKDLWEEVIDTMYESDNEDSNILVAKQITFGGKSYENYGQVVMVGGGSGSGKGFQISQLFGITGKNYDVDSLKEFVKKNNILRDKLSEKYGVSESVFDMKTPKDVSEVHTIIKQEGLQQKYENMIFNMAKYSGEKTKTNLIFDKTFDSFVDFVYVTERVKEMGYDPKNIHFVWVVNDYRVALEQNKNRSRTVDENIVMSIHKHTSMTIKDILQLGDKLRKYMDGDFWISFNKIDVDVKSEKLGENNYHITDATYYKIKEKGGSLVSYEELNKDMINKIKEYVPNGEIW